ncbi:hypothetical protein EDB19DRAFT_1721720 [Suillus lakei]|nr:hypothetical protein EDB19DRAFT_1721720 [Suillus lakei]
MSASELLRQSMQNLRVTEAKSTQPPLVPPRFPCPHQLDLSYPPRHRHTQYYGFWIDREWLTDLGKNIHYPEDRLDPPSDRDFWLRGFGHISWAVRIDPLTIQVCLQPKQDGAPPKHVDADGEVFVLSVCSDDEADYPVIPFQEQVDYLENLFGRKPRWWVGIWPRNDWE